MILDTPYDKEIYSLSFGGGSEAFKDEFRRQYYYEKS